MKTYLVLIGLVCVASCASDAAAQQLRAGAATSNITPEIGREIIGGFVPFPSTHIHDELHARCLVLDDGKTKIALVVCDLLGISRSVSEMAREQIAKRNDIPKSHVMISATHTHSASSALGQDSRKLGQSVDEYQKFVARRVADAVARALNQLEPAEIAFGIAQAPEHVFNRRWFMRPGTVPVNPFGGSDAVKMNPPRANPNLTEPAGPTDPAIPFLSVRAADGRPIALFAAYSLHYVGGVSKGHVSADYFAVFSERLKERLTETQTETNGSPPFVAMIANATSGDINNINFREKRPRRKPFEQIQLVGEDVAKKVHEAMSALEYRDQAQLAAVYREPVVAWRRPSAKEKKWAEETLAAGRKKERDLSFIYAQRAMTLAEYPETTTVPLQILRVGDVCIGTMPFEVFCEIGLEFKSRCPIQPAFMVELAHGYFGYLPTPRHHALGGYETWLGTNRVERGASDKLLDELLDMAAEVHAEKK